MDRREALRLMGCGGCALAAGSACTIAEVFGGDGVLEFDLAAKQFAALSEVDGVVAVDASGRSVLLIRSAEDRIVALNRICTHTACDMAPDKLGAWEDGELICRCHDSRFDSAGTVLKGPATRDLASYTVDFDPSSGRGTVTFGDDEDEEVSPGRPPEPLPPELAQAQNPFGDDEEAIEAGKALYETHCLSCHAEDGAGDGLATMPPPTAFDVDQTGYSDGYLFWRIKTGPIGGPEGSAMPAYDNSLSDEQIWRMVSYLRSLQP